MIEEKWRVIEKEHLIFNVSNKGSIQVLDSKKGKLIKTLKEVNQFSLIGGHEGNRYLSTHGYYVHRLVAEAWIGPIPKGYEVNHIDGNKKNNEASNLEIITNQQNKIHAFQIGLQDKIKTSESVKIRNEMKALNKRWGVYDLDFKIIRTHETQYKAAKSIQVTRQSVNNSCRSGKPILNNFYVCQINKIDDLKEKVNARRSLIE